MKCLACQNDVDNCKPFLSFDPNYLYQEWQQSGVETKLESGSLYCCENCSLWFRSPYPSPNVLEDLYSSIPNPIWSEPVDKEYWQEIRTIIAQQTRGNKVLDVGCYSGDFLSFMSDEYDKFGIEPSQYARNIASSRGIQILGTTIEKTQLISESFDAIVMLDVLEHLQSPVQVLGNYYQGLKSGGILVIATGATETFFFKVFKQYYWYANISMHCTFYSLSWFQWLSQKLPFEIIEYCYFSAGNKLGISKFFKSLLIKILYIFFRSYEKYSVVKKLFKLPVLRLIPNLTAVPWLIDATDQILIVLRK